MATIDQIKAHNKSAGYHFFEYATMRFFRSRVSPTIYQGNGRIIFITSEQFTPNGPRRYTVREYSASTGKVTTAGEFNKLSRDAAIDEAVFLTKKGKA